MYGELSSLVGGAQILMVIQVARQTLSHGHANSPELLVWQPWSVT